MKKSIIFVLTLLAGITTVSAAEPETQTDSVAQAQNAPQVTVKKNADSSDGKVYDVNGDGQVNITDYITYSIVVDNVSNTNVSVSSNKFDDFYDDDDNLKSEYDYNNDDDITEDDLPYLLDAIKNNK